MVGHPADELQMFSLSLCNSDIYGHITLKGIRLTAKCVFFHMTYHQLITQLKEKIVDFEILNSNFCGMCIYMYTKYRYCQ